MWILIKIIAALIAFFIRCIYKASPPAVAGTINNIPYYSKISRDKHGTILSYSIGVPFNVPIMFSFHKENSWDVFFKTIGLSEEFETGKAKFDNEIYVACDNYALHKVLLESQQARIAIYKALGSSFTMVSDDGKRVVNGLKFKKISCDGSVLWLKKSCDHEPRKEELDLMMEIRASLLGLVTTARRHIDPFEKSVMVVEAFVWSIFAYALMVCIENVMHKEDYHVYSSQLAIPGLLSGFLLFCLLFLMVATLLKGSSRGHRIIIEAGILLLISLPVAGVELVSDINRGFDKSNHIISREVLNTEKRRHRSRRTTYYTYHLIMPRDDYYGMRALPSDVSVRRDIYINALPGDTAVFQIGGGTLGYPWYREIEIHKKQ